MRCADAIELILREAGRPLRAREIADEVNRRGVYQRGNGRPLPTYQVSSVVHGLPGRFSVAAGHISINEGAPAPVAAPDVAPIPESEVAAILVGCVSGKESTARPARELYRTELFRRRREYAERSGRPWFIVSALYGLLLPDQIVEPYDLRLTDLAWEERHALAASIADDLEHQVGSLAGQVFEVHAGEEYARMLGLALRPHGATIIKPLAGLRIGEQLAWYGTPSAAPAAVTRHEGPVATAKSADAPSG
jgi:hypothetical protein